MADPETSRAAPEERRLPTGVEGLDEILRGGLPASRLFLVEGAPGSGKTTLAMQFVLAQRGPSPALYITMAESEVELRSSARSHGWSLDGIEIFEIIPSRDSLSPEGRYTMYHPSEVELSETVRKVQERVERVRPGCVVVDSLSELRLLADNQLVYRRQILALKQFFLQLGCTVLFLDDRVQEQRDMHLFSLAHGVISLEQHTPDYGSARRRLQVLKMRGQDYLAGYHDCRIVFGGLQIFPRLVAAEHKPGAALEAVPTGSAALDELLRGGLTTGTSTLIMGASGTGKSTLATLISRTAAQRGQPVAMFLFDEAEGTFHKRLEGLNLGVKPLIDDGRLTLRQIDPAELAPGEFVHAVFQVVEEQGVKLVVIDSLNGFMQAMPSERHLVLQLHEMLTYLAQMGVTTLLVLTQHGLVGERAESMIDASYVADSVILLRFFESLGEVKQAISVIKKRTGGHERTIRELRLGGMEGIEIGAPLREFEGVLSGTPRYRGGSLLRDAADDR